MIRLFTSFLFLDTCCLLTKGGGVGDGFSNEFSNEPNFSSLHKSLCLQVKFSKGINIPTAWSSNQKTLEIRTDGKGR